MRESAICRHQSVNMRFWTLLTVFDCFWGCGFHKLKKMSLYTYLFQYTICSMSSSFEMLLDSHYYAQPSTTWVVDQHKHKPKNITRRIKSVRRIGWSGGLHLTAWEQWTSILLACWYAAPPQIPNWKGSFWQDTQLDLSWFCVAQIVVAQLTHKAKRNPVERSKKKLILHCGRIFATTI